MVLDILEEFRKISVEIPRGMSDESRKTLFEYPGIILGEQSRPIRTIAHAGISCMYKVIEELSRKLDDDKMLLNTTFHITAVTFVNISVESVQTPLR